MKLAKTMVPSCQVENYLILAQSKYLKNLSIKKIKEIVQNSILQDWTALFVLDWFPVCKLGTDVGMPLLHPCSTSTICNAVLIYQDQRLLGKYLINASLTWLVANDSKIGVVNNEDTAFIQSSVDCLVNQAN